MLQIETTKNQKIILIVIAGTLIVCLLTYFFLITPYKSYRQVKQENALLTNQIKEQYQEIVRLKNLKKEYIKNEKYLKETKSKLSLNGAELLTVLTKYSPVKNFFLSSLEMKEKKEKQDEITQYPFEIGFKSDFKKVGEYLLYQESSLPISFIENIEVKPAREKTNSLETKISGIIYKVN